MFLGQALKTEIVEVVWILSGQNAADLITKYYALHLLKELMGKIDSTYLPSHGSID